jgi:hypothetical protein
MQQMNAWYSVDLGDGVDSRAPTEHIQKTYLLMASATRLPTDCAVFSYYDLHANIVTVYFSPSAVKLAAMFNAAPCKKPENKEGFGLLVGDRRAWQLLFPA